MPRIMKFILYPIIFALSFLVFLYLVFPYDILKDRVISAVEQQLGSGWEVEVKGLKPYWFTGIEVTGLSIVERGPDKVLSLLECKKAYARASFLSLLVGRPNVSFDVQMGKGEVAGFVKQSEDALAIKAEFDDFDLDSLKIIASRIGLSLSSKINGDVDLYLDKQNPLRSTGRISLEFSELKAAASNVNISEMTLKLPDVLLSKGRESRIKLDIGKGVIAIDTFKFTGGDLNLDLKGKVFLSTKLGNYRLNLDGTFSVSKTLADALSFLFLVEKQKQADESYPLSITGPLAKPSIKIGTVTVL